MIMYLKNDNNNLGNSMKIIMDVKEQWEKDNNNGSTMLRGSHQ